MLKIYILFLFLILFIIPCLFIFNSKHTEHFANKDKSQEQEEFILNKNENQYYFKYKDDEIDILPSNKSNKINDIYFAYTSFQDKKLTTNLKFDEIDDQTFKLTTPKNIFEITTSKTEIPLKISMNNGDKTIEFQKASTGNTKDVSVFNIMSLKSTIGNVTLTKIKDKINTIIIKSKDDMIKKTPDTLIAIFTAFLIFDKLVEMNKSNYDKIFTNDSPKP